MRVIRRRFQESDVVGNWLVVSATGGVSVEKAVNEVSSRAGVFCNGVDDKGNCSYITPAIVDRSPIVIAVSSAAGLAS